MLDFTLSSFVSWGYPINPFAKGDFSMAKFLEVTTNVKITDGGASIVDRQLTHTMEVEEIVEGTVRVQSGASKFICVEGEEGSEPSPLSLGLSRIRGYKFMSDVQVEILEDGALTGTKSGPGAFGPDNCTLDSIKISNASGLPANIKYIIWGDR